MNLGVMFWYCIHLLTKSPVPFHEVLPLARWMSTHLRNNMNFIKMSFKILIHKSYLMLFDYYFETYQFTFILYEKDLVLEVILNLSKVSESIFLHQFSRFSPFYIHDVFNNRDLYINKSF